MPTSLFIDRKQAGRTLLQILQTSMQLARKDALRALGDRQVTISGGVCTDGERRLKIGQHVQLTPARKETPTGIVIRHVDADIIVVEKPAGLTTVRHADEAESFGKRAKKFLPPTLVDLLPAAMQAEGHANKGRIRAVH